MAATSPPTVLHVDDDTELLELARTSLATDQFVLRTAESADEGLHAIETGSIDCLVSDSLQTSDGEPFVAAARRRAPDLPIVIFTGSEWEDLGEPVRAEAAGYVRKGDAEAFARLRTRLERVADSRLEEPVDLETEPSRNGDLPRVLAADSTDWEVADRRAFEDGEELVYVVTRLLADRTGLEEETLPPLYHTLDIELAEELLDGCGSDVALRFTYLDYEVAVLGDGVVALRERSEAGDEQPTEWPPNRP